MRKGMVFAALLLILGLVLVRGVEGQENSPTGAFSGTITKVDLAKKEIVVQNNDTEMTFQWNNKTRVKGPGEEELIFEDLKEGSMVTVLYKEGDGNRVANRIDIQTVKPTTLKGIELPFECGVKVC